jgi:hypothetical protein
MPSCKAEIDPICRLAVSSFGKRGEFIAEERQLFLGNLNSAGAVALEHTMPRGVWVGFGGHDPRHHSSSAFIEPFGNIAVAHNTARRD